MPQAFILELTPMGTCQGPPPSLIMGHHWHGFFFALLAKIDPALARELHDARRKPFTLTQLPGCRTPLRLRVTTLDDALFAPVLKAMVSESTRGLPLRDHLYAVQRVVTTSDGHPLAGQATWTALSQSPSTQTLTLRFITPTVFITSKPGGRTRYTPLPDPRLILSSLLASWQAHSPTPYSAAEEAALRNLFELDSEIAHFKNLRFHRIHAGKATFPGFTGDVTIRLFTDRPEALQALGRLGALAFFSGVGAKTPYGMGLAVPVTHVDDAGSDLTVLRVTAERGSTGQEGRDVRAGGGHRGIASARS